MCAVADRNTHSKNDAIAAARGLATDLHHRQQLASSTTATGITMACVEWHHGANADYGARIVRVGGTSRAHSDHAPGVPAAATNNKYFNPTSRFRGRPGMYPASGHDAVPPCNDLLQPRALLPNIMAIQQCVGAVLGHWCFTVQCWVALGMLWVCKVRNT